MSHPPVRSETSSIAAEIFDVNSAGRHIFTYNIHEAAGPSWRSYSTHLPDTEPSSIVGEIFDVGLAVYQMILDVTFVK